MFGEARGGGLDIGLTWPFLQLSESIEDRSSFRAHFILKWMKGGFHLHVDHIIFEGEGGGNGEDADVVGVEE